jgi:hypothetical protein
MQAPVCAELYKLLLYEPGSFFTQHKDSEKVSNHIAEQLCCLFCLGSCGPHRPTALDLQASDSSQLLGKLLVSAMLLQASALTQPQLAYAAAPCCTTRRLKACLAP